ncbi:MAG TPA: YeeE/YedE family protein [Methylophilus sp.]|nr:YeeE/YedE family protein [Methylophilus sp.]HQQ33176.1 YeeE/YedE family protein [Methylophilus sp.]
MSIDTINFTPVASLAGGVMIGIATAILILFSGRIAGISNILGGVVRFSETRQNQWRIFFLAGLILAPWVYGLFFALPVAEVELDNLGLVVAGLLVGYGTRLGSGCTSGHGVCGLSRLSIRSLVATLVFMTTGVITVYLMHH